MATHGKATPKPRYAYRRPNTDERLAWFLRCAAMMHGPGHTDHSVRALQPPHAAKQGLSNDGRTALAKTAALLERVLLRPILPSLLTRKPAYHMQTSLPMPCRLNCGMPRTISHAHLRTSACCPYCMLPIPSALIVLYLPLLHAHGMPSSINVILSRQTLVVSVGRARPACVVPHLGALADAKLPQEALGHRQLLDAGEGQRRMRRARRRRR